MARNKFDIDEELKTAFNLAHARRLLRYVKPYRGNMILSVLLMLVASVCTLLSPYIAKVAIDDMIPEGNIKGLFLLAGALLATLLVNAVFLRTRIMIMSRTGQNIIHNIRRDLFVHLQQLPFTYFDSRPLGKILVRVVNYVNSLSDLLSNGIINFITDLFTLVAIVAFMLAINTRLTLICMAGLPVLVSAIFLLKNAQRKGWQAVSRKAANLNAYSHESICGIKVTQSFTREDENLRIFRSLGDEAYNAWMGTIRVQNLLWMVVDIVSVAGIIMVYVTGNAWIGRPGSGITVGVMIAFCMYIGRFWEPIANLGNFYNAIVNAMAYLESIFEMQDEEVVVRNLPGAVEMPLIKGDVEFRGVSFKYEEDGNTILENVSFKVRSGDTIALVGPTGAGKTTTVSLISRFYNVKEGAVLIDGIDISRVTLESLRSQMGVMMQDTFIFSGTVMDNIRYSRLDAADEQVVEAAKAVKAHEFIMEMKDGYQTQVNERGSRLSTGQRQLISFARALLADPRILILDEATSSIDSRTEMALQEGLERLLRGRTSFVIAHRLSTIRNASCIMYIDDGRITEQGTHEELMARQGDYWKLYTAQYSFLDIA